MSESMPIVCTLSGDDRAQRDDWWNRVRERASAVVRLDGGYRLEFADPALWEELSEIVEAERSCCNWMKLDLTRSHAISLTLESDDPLGREFLHDAFR